MNLHETIDISFASRKTAPSHATIIWGGCEDARLAYAEDLAAAIICDGSGDSPCRTCIHCAKSLRGIHPDIIKIDRNPDTRALYVDQIRALRKDAVLLPNEANKKVYLVNHAGSMNTSAQNAILKLLEEPPTHTAFILVTENPIELLPTVRSRCIEISVNAPRSDKSPEDNANADAFIKALSAGPLDLAAFSFSLESLEKNEFIDFIDSAAATITLLLRAQYTEGTGLLSGSDLMKILRILDRAKTYFYNNVGLGHIAGMICAELSIRNEENHD